MEWDRTCRLMVEKEVESIGQTIDHIFNQYAQSNYWLAEVRKLEARRMYLQELLKQYSAGQLTMLEFYQKSRGR